MASSLVGISINLKGVAQAVGGLAAVNRSLDGLKPAANRGAVGATKALEGTSKALGAVASRAKLAGVALAGVGAVSTVAAIGPAASGAAAAVAGLGVAAGGVLVPAMALAAGVVARYRDTADLAGSAANKLKESLGGLKNAANKAISPASANVMEGLADAAKIVTPVVASLRGAFSGFGTAAGNAVRTVAQGVAQLGPELRQMIGQAGGLLTALAPAVAPLLGVFLDIANAAMPVLVDLAGQFAGMVQSWRPALQGVNLGGVVAAGIAPLKSVASILWSLIRIAGSVGVALAPLGGRLLAGLADGLDRLADFVTTGGRVTGALTAIGQAAGWVGRQVTTGFAVIRRVATQLAAQLGPPLRQAFSGLIDGVRSAMPFFQNVVGPLLGGIFKGLAIAVVGAARVIGPVLGFAFRALGAVLGFVGRAAAPLKGVFSAIGQVISFVFGGAILRVIGWVGKLAPFLGKLGPVARGVGSVFSFVGGVLGRLAGAFGRVIGFVGRFVGSVASSVGKVPGLFASMVSRVGSAFGRLIGWVKGLGGRIAAATTGMWDGIKNSFRSAVNWLIGKWNNLSFTIGGGGALKKLGIDIPTITLNTPNIPMLASGGTIRRGGAALVGERGPELVRFRGAEVVHNARQTAAFMGGQPAGAVGGIQSDPAMVAAIHALANRPIHIDVQVSGQTIARVVASEASRAARGRG